MAPLGWDTNFTWLQSRSGSSISGRPWSTSSALTATPGAYIPELAEKWEMAPDGKSWTISPAQGRQVPRELGRVHRQRRAPRGLSHHPAGVRADRCRLLAHADGDREDRLHRGRWPRKSTGGGDRQRLQVVFRLKYAAPELSENHLGQRRPGDGEQGALGCRGQGTLWAEGGGHRPLRVRRAQGGLARALQAGGKPLAQDPGVQRTRVPLGAGGGDAPGHPAGRRGAHLRCRPGPAEGCGGQGHEDLSPANCRPCSTSGTLAACTLPPRTSWTRRCPL